MRLVHLNMFIPGVREESERVLSRCGLCVGLSILVSLLSAKIVYMYNYIYLYIYINISCVCMYMCLCI